MVTQFSHLNRWRLVEIGFAFPLPIFHSIDGIPLGFAAISALILSSSYFLFHSHKHKNYNNTIANLSSIQSILRLVCICVHAKVIVICVDLSKFPSIIQLALNRKIAVMYFRALNEWK